MPFADKSNSPAAESPTVRSPAKDAESQGITNGQYLQHSTMDLLLQLVFPIMVTCSQVPSRHVLQQSRSSNGVLTDMHLGYYSSLLFHDRTLLRAKVRLGYCQPCDMMRSFTNAKDRYTRCANRTRNRQEARNVRL